MSARKPISQSGDMKVMRDYLCPSCKKLWEERLSDNEFKAGAPKCTECGVQGEKQLSAPGIDSHAARSWRS